MVAVTFKTLVIVYYIILVLFQSISVHIVVYLQRECLLLRPVFHLITTFVPFIKSPKAKNF